MCTVTNDLSYDQRMIRICTALADAGYAVELIGRQKKTSIPLIPQPFKQKRLRCFFEKGKLFYLEFNLRLCLFLLFHPLDLLYAVDLDTLLPAALIKGLKRKIFIFDAHEYFTETPEVERRPMVKKIWELLATLLIPQAAACLTVSESLKKELSMRYGKDFKLVRNLPVEYNRAVVSKKESKPTIILYQGYLNEGRGLECAIESLVLLPDAQLWLAGEGDITESLRQLTISLGLENQVLFLGFLPPEALRDITTKASIGLNLLETRSKSYYYSLANKTFDYIQAGLPAIHMDFPEYQVLMANYKVGLLLPSLHPEKLRNAILELTSNPQTYQQMVNECRKAAPVFIWKKEIPTLLESVESCLSTTTH